MRLPRVAGRRPPHKQLPRVVAHVGVAAEGVDVFAVVEDVEDRERLDGAEADELFGDAAGVEDGFGLRIAMRC